ncbi:MAG: hypothetical protein J7L54_00265 [Elusimicrobia bacterium]|nr:hypothetical protein [Elusimicrobiota bacterium]
MKGRTQIFKIAVIGGIVAYVLVGIVVLESVETVKIGYQIAALNRKWQEENFRFAALEKKYRKLTNFATVEKKAKEMGLRFPRPGEIIFLKNDNQKQ